MKKVREHITLPKFKSIFKENSRDVEYWVLDRREGFLTMRGSLKRSRAAPQTINSEWT